MASSFTWLDYSEHERRKMLDVIDLFREKDTRDELGIGTVRDAFADMLFPGTSTIQTRARYFLFVPWIYLDLERRNVSSNKVAVGARRAEIALINALATSEDTDGIIGKRAREALQRLPSNIYWQGLGVWGIRVFHGSQDQYHRSLDRFYTLTSRKQRNDDGDPVDGKTSSNWHSGLPKLPGSFPHKTSFRLTREEAQYLHERIMTRAPGTLLVFLVDRGQKTQKVDFPWAHPQFAKFPPRIREQLEHARNFSEAIHSAALLYNLMLAEQTNWKEQVDEYQAWLQKWASKLDERPDAFARWDRRRFWEIIASGRSRVTHPTLRFIDTWLDLALSQPIAKKIAAHQPARQLIHERERFLKRDLARLDNPRALELWNGAAGTAQLDYRWGVAQTIISDILTGFAREGQDA